MDAPKDKKKTPDEGRPAKRVIRLEDLDRDDDVVGGAGQKLFFGEQPTSATPFAGLFPTPEKRGPTRD